VDLVVVERKTGPADVDFHSILLEEVFFFLLLCVIAKFIDRVLSPPRSSASSLLFSTTHAWVPTDTLLQHHHQAHHQSSARVKHPKSSHRPTVVLFPSTTEHHLPHNIRPHKPSIGDQQSTAYTILITA
jgi:hypothetical protein